MSARYNFSLFKAYVWKDMWAKRFWKMWGIKQTLKYLIAKVYEKSGFIIDFKVKTGCILAVNY